VTIADALLERILHHARTGYPFEVCGVLLASAGAPGRIVAVEPVQNRETESPRVRYQIAPEDLIRIQRGGRAGGLEIAGYYHSHPDHPARPSETDRRIAAEGLSDGVFHMVIGVEQGTRTTPSAWVFRDASQAFEPVALDVEATTGAAAKDAPATHVPATDATERRA
jgi:proteasome lid subunit RPN8/RPN11